MKTILVDDELWSMEQFKRECEKSEFFDIAGMFCYPTDALEYARENKVEFALLDIEMPEMDGLTLGRKLREIHPDIVVVFVTAHSKYAIDAIKQKADYYVLKPYTLFDVEDAISRAHLLSQRQGKRIFIRTFGRFDVFVDGRAIVFTSAKAKELLALLVDKNGGVLTTEEAFSVLWEDKPYSDANYSLCRKSFKRLSEMLDEHGISELVITSKNGRMINKDVYDCDYCRLLSGDEKARNEFNGEYLSNYSWGEETLAKLLKMTGYFD